VVPGPPSCFLREEVEIQHQTLLILLKEYREHVYDVLDQPSSTGIALLTEEASTSETSADFYRTTLFNKPGRSNLHTRSHKNLKSHQIVLTNHGWKRKLRKNKELPL
jgi:hypothetical protein